MPRWPDREVQYEHMCSECGKTFPAYVVHAHLCSGKCRTRRSRRLRKEAQHGNAT